MIPKRGLKIHIHNNETATPEATLGKKKMVRKTESPFTF